MKSGALNNRILIEKPDFKRDGYGTQIIAWRAHQTLWANVRVQNGAENQRNNVDLRTVKVSFRVRLNRSLLPEMRVIFRGQIYAIHAVLHDEQGREYTDLSCVLQIGDGK